MLAVVAAAGVLPVVHELSTMVHWLRPTHVTLHVCLVVLCVCVRERVCVGETPLVLLRALSSARTRAPQSLLSTPKTHMMTLVWLVPAPISVSVYALVALG